jgi:hypothetical protein
MLLQIIHDFVKKPLTRARAGIRTMIAQSIRELRCEIRDARLDMRFARMRNDQQYQQRAVQIASEFERSDHEALTGF